MGTIFKLTPTSNEKIEGFKQQAVKELNDFFEKNWKPDSFKIILVGDRKTIDLWHGKETQSWMVGWAISTNSIILLNPSSYSTESAHKYSDTEYFKLIKHELSHQYFQTIYSLSQFPWINEGVSVYLANQIENTTKPKEFKGFLEGKNLYWESGHAIKILVDKFGKEKLFELLRRQSGIKDFDKLNTVFIDVYGHSLNYEFFNTQ